MNNIFQPKIKQWPVILLFILACIFTIQYAWAQDDCPPTFAATSGSATICPGSSYTLSSGEASASGGLINWSHNGKGTLAGASTLTPTYQSDGADEGHEVLLTMNVRSECSQNGSVANYVINVTSFPLASAGGSADICFYDQYTLKTGEAAAQNATYIYWRSNGAGFLTDSWTLTPTYYPYYGDEGKTITLTLVAMNDCGEATANYQINVAPMPLATINGGLVNICQSQPYTLAVGQATANTNKFKWYVVDGAGILSGGNTLTPTYTPSPADAGRSVMLGLSVESDNNCSSTNSFAILTLNVSAAPWAALNNIGMEYTCESNPYTLRDRYAFAGNGDISWEENGAGTFTEGDHSLRPTYMPAADDAGKTITLTMHVTGQNDCGDTEASDSFSLHIDPRPTAAVTGSGSTYVNTPYTLAPGEASASNGNIFWWTRGSGILTNTNTLTPTYTPGAEDAGMDIILTLQVGDENSCDPAYAEYVLTVMPVREITITSQPVNVATCLNANATFSVTGDESFHYQWYKKGYPNIALTNGGNISGANTMNLTLSTVAVRDTGRYFVLVSGDGYVSVQSQVARLAVKVLTINLETVQVTDRITLTGYLYGGAIGFDNITKVNFMVEGRPYLYTLGKVGNDKKLALTMRMLAVPGVQTITAEFKNNANLTQGCIPSKDILVTCEDASIVYNGVEIQATPTANSSEATVRLMAVVSEANDGATFNITDPVICIKFEIFDGTSLINTVTAQVESRLTPDNSVVGIASADVPINIGTADFKAYTIKMTVGGCTNYYCAQESRATLLIYKPAGDFITGGGHIVTYLSSGVFTGAPGSNDNFGFHVKFNKKSTTLQGGMNAIFRKEISGSLHDLQIKSNSMVSLGVNVTDPSKKLAVFTSKANLTDLTTGMLLEGNLQLTVTMTDRGEPGNNDAIGMTLWRLDSKGKPTALLYSSRWFGSVTNEELLAGGNLVVHSGFSYNASLVGAPILKNAEGDSPLAEVPGVKVYPNPFNDRVNFGWVSPIEVNTRMDIYDVTGRIIETVFNQMVEKDVTYNVVFKPKAAVSSIYFYRLTMGDKVFNGKVIYKK